MIVNDLEILELVEDNNRIIGGTFTSTQAIALTSPDSSYAIASGIAVGDTTSTNVRTSALNYKTDLFSASFAFADVSALAITDSNIYLSSNTQISYYFGFKL